MRGEIAQDDSIVAVGTAVLEVIERIAKYVAIARGLKLAQIDGQLRERQRGSLMIHALTDDQRLAKIGLVLYPVKVDLQVIQRVRRGAIVYEREQLRHKLARNGPPSLWQIVDVQVHSLAP